MNFMFMSYEKFGDESKIYRALEYYSLLNLSLAYLL